MKRLMFSPLRVALLGVSVFTTAGCRSSPVHSTSAATTQSANQSRNQSADASDFYALAGVGEIVDDDFDRLWTAAEKVSRAYLFDIDLRDRRGGVLTTLPSVSPQFFEPWRRELQSSDDLAESSLATLRRTIRFDFTRTAGTYAVTPRVLVERQVSTERRVSGVLSKAYLRTPRGGEQTFGSRETDAGQTLEPGYWYPIRRDTALEARLLEAMRMSL